MNKTQQLIKQVKAGTHRIRNGSVYRFVETRNEWMTFPHYRSDVILRAEVAMMKK